MVSSPIFRTAACVFGILISAAAPAAQAQEAAAPATAEASGKSAPAAPAAPSKTAPTMNPPSAAPSPAPAAAQPAPVYCGSFTPFRFRVMAFGKDPDTRASFATDIINKYLGGAVGKFTTRLDPKTKNVRLLLNNELIAIVSPADAAAEKQKSATLLAAKWVKLLSLAFEASKAQR
ncbi:MAG: hypothetical protein ACO1SX_22530 [Actinomycetota bacterium]